MAELDPLQQVFRDVMAAVATPVSVITGIDDEGPHGTTVSAFASLSMTPPMVLVALDRGSDLLALVRKTERFGVNVLGTAHAALAMTFAGKGRGKFEGVEWRLEDELPRLDGAPGWLACRVDQFVDGGDHVIALGQVVAAETVEGAPLTYHGRVFGTHQALPA
jgi:flavin reductase (DIM6/NTAB) family NADH-FMN oxidoreductase RutF